MNIQNIILFLLGLLLLGAPLRAQNAQPAASQSWGRLQSANGQLSVEFPTSLTVIRNKEGAAQPQDGGGLYWREMRILSSYNNGTLLSVEIYKESKEALEVVIAGDSTPIEIKGVPVVRKAESFKNGDITIRQVTQTTPDSFMVRRYFNSGSHIYILTAASRGKATPDMHRFLDSVTFDPKSKTAGNASGVDIDSLPNSPLEVIQKGKADNLETVAFLQKSKGSELIVLAKPRPSFTDQARMNQVQGKVRLRTTFGISGTISKVEIITGLAGGLTRQALFSALRSKFLPDEVAGVPKPFEGILEYTFTIY